MKYHYTKPEEESSIDVTVKLNLTQVKVIHNYLLEVVLKDESLIHLTEIVKSLDNQIKKTQS